jgi:hypothetical protein
MAPNSNVPSYIVQVISYNQAQGSPSSIPMLSGYQLLNIPDGTGIAKSFYKICSQPGTNTESFLKLLYRPGHGVRVQG